MPRGRHERNGEYCIRPCRDGASHTDVHARYSLFGGCRAPALAQREQRSLVLEQEAFHR